MAYHTSDLAAMSYVFSDGFPLPLRDACVLSLMMRLDEFTTPSLAMLPREIRSKLVNSLSPADILHLQGTAVLEDVVVDTSLVSAANQLIRWCLGDQDVPSLPAKFFSVRICCSHKHTIRGKGLRKNPSFLVCPVITEHIRTCYSFYCPTVNQTILVPARFQPFECAWNSGRSRLSAAAIDLLLQYCSQLSPAFTDCEIQCSHFAANSPLWTIYKTHLLESQTSNDLVFDPTFPAMQKLVSHFEVMKINNEELAFDCEDRDMVPYAVIYNTVTCKCSRLKHLIVKGQPTEVAKILDSIAVLFHGHSHQSSLSNFGIPLPNPPAPPYLLEQLSIILEKKYGATDSYTEVSDEVATRISVAVKTIVDYQLHNLKQVNFEGLGFCRNEKVNVPDYRGLLSTLADFLKQPQVHSVRVTRSPLLEAFQMIENFLSTPTTHEQTLEIGAIHFKEFKKRANESSKELKRSRTLTSITTSTSHPVAQLQRRMSLKSFSKKSQGLSQTRRKLSFSSLNRQSCDIADRTSTLPSQKSSLKVSKKAQKYLPSLKQSAFPDSNSYYKRLNLIATSFPNSNSSTSIAYYWLFNHCTELRLQELTMTMKDINFVSLELNLQVVRLRLYGDSSNDSNHVVSPIHLESFIVANTALKRVTLLGNNPSILSALNHCLTVLNLERRGPDLIHLSMGLLKVDDLTAREFFTKIRDLSYCPGTILSFTSDYSIVQLGQYPEPFSTTFLASLGEDLNGQRIKRIGYSPSRILQCEHAPLCHFNLIADEIVCVNL